MKKGIIAWLFICLSTSAGFAQELETDRPDVSETPALVPKNYLQGEFGFRREKQTSSLNVWTHPSGLIRYGLSRHVELRFENTYKTEKHSIPGTEYNVTGFEVVQLGTKIFLAEEKGAFPKTSFIAHVGINPLSSSEFEPDEPVGSLRFVMKNNLTDKAQLAYNLGVEWEGESASPKFLYTFSPQADLTDKLSMYVELFGYIGKNDFHDHNFDAGLQYALADNFKADLSGGFGLSKASLKHYIEVGFSFMFPLSKK